MVCKYEVLCFHLYNSLRLHTEPFPNNRLQKGKETVSPEGPYKSVMKQKQAHKVHQDGLYSSSSESSIVWMGEICDTTV